MALDYSVLQGIDPAGAFFRGQEAVRAEADRNLLRQAQMEQMAAQRENMLAQRQEREAQAATRRAQEARAAQRQRLLTGAADALRQGGHTLNRDTLQQILASAIETDEPTLFQFATQTLKALDEEDLYKREAARFNLPGGAAPAAPSVMRQPAAAMPAAPAAPPNLLAGTPYDIGVGAPAPVNALVAPPPAPAPAGAGFTREQVQQMLTSPSARIREQGKALASTLEKPQTYTPSADMQGYELAKSEGFKGTFFDYKRQLAEAGRPPAQPKEPPAPIPVVDPATGQVKYVPREQAVGMTPPAFMESLTPKERQVREAKFPQATSALKAFDNTATTLIKDLETLANHPGLPSITGIAAGRLPGITSQGREAQALYDKIMARGGFQELQNMRQASPTGGALGNVSNAEGQRLQAAFAALDRTQDAPSVRKAIRDAITQTQAAKQNLREAYDLTYEYKQRGGATPAAAPAAAPNIDALLNKYR